MHRYEIKFKDGETEIGYSEYDYTTYLRRIMGREYIVCSNNKLRKTSEIIGINEKGDL